MFSKGYSQAPEARQHIGPIASAADATLVQYIAPIRPNAEENTEFSICRHKDSRQKHTFDLITFLILELFSNGLCISVV